MKKIILLIFLVLNSIISISYANTNLDFKGKITKIVDGDTIYVSTGATDFKVRILGIDTPESYLFGGIKNYKYYGCGKAAKFFAIKSLSGQTLGFYKDDLAKNIDKYGRKLRFIKLSNNTNLSSNETYGYSLLKQGLANFYKYENQSFSGVYKKIDDENKIIGKGIYNPFCKAQDKYIKENGHRTGSGEIQNIINKTLLSKNNFHYQLQNTKFEQLKILTGTTIFIDPNENKLTGEQLGQLKQNQNIIIAYLSIGEAEPYRNYWNSSWVDSKGNLTNKAPDWLGDKNPNWNSYYVKYWLTGWQNIIFNQIKSIKNKGYDGVLLDTIDTYGYWSWYKGISDTDNKMIDFIKKIRQHLGDYLAIVPNGGLPLIEKTGYLDLINGQLTESLFSLNNEERPDTDKNWQLQYLDKVKQAGKQVFDIDYINGNNNLVCKYYDFIKQKGFLGAVYNLGLDSFEKIKCGNNSYTEFAHKFSIANQGTDKNYYYYQPAKNVIDDDLSSFNHTSAKDDENWLQIYIPGMIKVGKIEIKPRTGWAGRIEGTKVYVSNTAYNGNIDSNFKLVGTLERTDKNQVIDLQNPIEGKYIFIKALSGKNLHLENVNVYGIAQDQPLFNDYKTYFLLPYGTENGTFISQITGIDYQDDKLTYSLSGTNLPFRIDENGKIYTKQKLQTGTYDFQVIVSDGKTQTLSKTIIIKVTSQTAVEDAIKSGIVTDVTEKELIQAIIDNLNNKQNKTNNEKILLEMFNHFKNNDFVLDWSKCKNSDGEYGSGYDNCNDVPNLIKYKNALKSLKDIYVQLDKNKTDIFKYKNASELNKLYILLADKFRETIKFPMNKTKHTSTEWMKSYYADYVVYNYRDIAPVQADMGNFSRSDFSSITPITKIIELKTRRPFRAAGVYALPGQTFKVTRLDNEPVNISIFVNSLRAGATHEFGNYNRPKYLQSTHISLAPRETIKFTSVYGGPIQVGFKDNDYNIKLKFENIGEHPYWNGPEDNEKFTKAIQDNKYDWVELSTPGFEVHSKIEKFRETMKNWGNSEQVANLIKKYTGNYPFSLAGFHGNGIDKIQEAEDFAQKYNLPIYEVNFVKHMNADQAACGYGCSGNPYDAYWAFSPIGHGDIHEIGHGLEKARFRLKGFNYHSTTNPYSYYTKTQYNKQTGKDPDCQKLNFKTFFDKLVAAKKSSNYSGYLAHNLWSDYNDNGDWRSGFMFYLQSFMQVQKLGKLKDGWHFLTRWHILERAIPYVKKDWENRKASIGFTNYTLDEFNNISNNDWMLITMSFAAGLDFRNYFDMMGQPYSEKAAKQVENFHFPKTQKIFFVSTPDGYCKKDGYGNWLDKKYVEITKDAIWPEPDNTSTGNINKGNINHIIHHGGTTFKAPTCKNTQLVCKQVGNKFKLYVKDGSMCQNGNLGKKCNNKEIQIVINNNLTKNSYYIRIGSFKLLQIQNSKYNKLFEKIGQYIISKNFSSENKQKLINIINEIEKLLNIYSIKKTIKEELINKVKLFSNTYNKILNSKINKKINIKKDSYNYYDYLIKNKDIQYQIKLKIYLKKLLYKHNFSKNKLIILKEKIENILNNKNITSKLKNDKLLIYITLRKAIIEELTK